MGALPGQRNRGLRLGMLMPMAVSAESVYLFRHQVLRDGLYQLLLPSERARLHVCALGAYESHDESLQLARELAYHAGAALQGGLGRVEEKSVRVAQLGYLRRWATLANAAWLADETATAWRAVATHPDAEPLEAAQARIAAWGALEVSGKGREGLDELACCEKVLASLPEHGPAGPVHVKLRMLMARVLVSGGEPESSLRYGRSGVALAEALGDDAVLSEALDDLSWICSRTARLPEALNLQERAIAIARAAGLKDRVTRMLTTYAGILRETGRNHDAAAVVKEALAAARVNPGPRQLIAALNSAAISHRAEGEHAVAESLYREAMEIARKYGLHRGYAVVLGNYANILSGRGEYGRVEAMYRQVIAIDREDGSLGSEAVAWHNLSESWLGMGLLSAAVRGLEQAIALAARTHHFLLEARAWCNRAAILALLGRPAEALEPVSRGLACLEGRDGGKFMIEFGILSELVVKLAQPGVPDPRTLASAALERMEHLVVDSGLQADKFTARALDQVRKILDEYEAATKTGRAPRVVRGWLVESLTNGQRAALADSLKASGEYLPADLQAALTAGLEDTSTPDWSNHRRAEF
jgi:tetratricopeptide (TPR) repeat protein